MIRARLALAALAAAALASPSAAAPSLLPQPRTLTLAEGTLSVAAPFRVKAEGCPAPLIGHALARFQADVARQRGFRAMQFNFVVSTNERAVHLWTSLGFATVGRLPGAFLHSTLGYVDALVMYRAL